jgi:PAS domain-containing protein
MLGYEREELLGKHVADIARYGEAGEEWNEMRKHGARTGTSRLTCKDGTVVDFTYTAGATTVAGMPVFVSVGGLP